MTYFILLLFLLLFLLFFFRQMCSFILNQIFFNFDFLQNYCFCEIIYFLSFYDFKFYFIILNSIYFFYSILINFFLFKYIYIFLCFFDFLYFFNPFFFFSFIFLLLSLFFCFIFFLCLIIELFYYYLFFLLSKFFLIKFNLISFFLYRFIIYENLRRFLDFNIYHADNFMFNLYDSNLFFHLFNKYKLKQLIKIKIGDYDLNNNIFKLSDKLIFNKIIEIFFDNKSLFFANDKNLQTLNKIIKIKNNLLNNKGILNLNNQLNDNIKNKNKLIKFFYFFDVRYIFFNRERLKNFFFKDLNSPIVKVIIQKGLFIKPYILKKKYLIKNIKNSYKNIFFYRSTNNNNKLIIENNKLNLLLKQKAILNKKLYNKKLLYLFSEKKIPTNLTLNFNFKALNYKEYQNQIIKNNFKTYANNSEIVPFFWLNNNNKYKSLKFNKFSEKNFFFKENLKFENLNLLFNFFVFYNDKVIWNYNTRMKPILYKRSVFQIRKIRGDAIVNELLNPYDHKQAQIVRMKMHIDDTENFDLLTNIAKNNRNFRKEKNNILEMKYFFLIKKK